MPTGAVFAKAVSLLANRLPAGDSSVTKPLLTIPVCARADNLPAGENSVGAVFAKADSSLAGESSVWSSFSKNKDLSITRIIQSKQLELEFGEVYHAS